MQSLERNSLDPGPRANHILLLRIDKVKHITRQLPWTIFLLSLPKHFHWFCNFNSMPSSPVGENLTRLLSPGTDVWRVIKKGSQAYNSVVHAGWLETGLCSCYLCWINHRVETWEELFHKEIKVQCKALSSWKQQELTQKRRCRWSIGLGFRHSCVKKQWKKNLCSLTMWRQIHKRKGA